MNPLPLIIAQAAPDPTTINGWWDIAQKLGSGGALVLGVVIYFLARAYTEKDKQLTAEVAYSKERDKSTMTIMLELTALIKGMDQRDRDYEGKHHDGLQTLLKELLELKTLLKEHLNTNKRP